jgi:hypothetical protein
VRLCELDGRPSTQEKQGEQRKGWRGPEEQGNNEKSPRRVPRAFSIMVGMRGFEPPTPCSRRKCSSQQPGSFDDTFDRNRGLAGIARRRPLSARGAVGGLWAASRWHAARRRTGEVPPGRLRFHHGNRNGARNGILGAGREVSGHHGLRGGSLSQLSGTVPRRRRPGRGRGSAG